MLSYCSIYNKLIKLIYHKVDAVREKNHKFYMSGSSQNNYSKYYVATSNNQIGFPKILISFNYDS